MAAKHVKDDNFKKEVLENKNPVLVDFYADWCVDPETQVTMSDRQTLPADRVMEGQSIVSFKDGLHKDKVDYSKTVSDGGHCKQVVTEAGRQIKVTDDHLFWTDEGWKAAQDLVGGNRVAVYPTVDSIKAEKKVNRVLFSEKSLRKVANERMRVGQYIEELQEKSLLPLRLNSKQLPIIARLMGALFTDGTLYIQESNNYREISFVLGSEKDVEMLQHDLEILGFSFHVSERTNKQEISGRSFTAHTYRVKCLSTALWLLFKAVGVPVGNKTNQAYGLPEWLMTAPLLIKREFLAGFLGGDGPRLHMFESKRAKGNSYNSLTINDLEFYKRSDVVDSGQRLAGQLSQLLSEFGVEIVKVFNKKAPYKRKDGSQTVVIHVKFRQKFETGYNLATKIGYAYCWEKEKSAIQVGEFLRRAMVRRSRWFKVYQQAIELAGNTRLSPVMIARRLGISNGAVWGWLRYGRKPTTFNHFEKFSTWIKEVTLNLKDGLVWDVISELDTVFLPKVQRITVEKKNSFVANGFVVHNCGPCKMAAPILDELADEYKGKVDIFKLDVDDNKHTPQHYGIMSIPTVVAFKGGREVNRKIGFGGKVGYEELLKKLVS